MSPLIGDHKLLIMSHSRFFMTPTIRIEKETRDQLRSFGRKGETYDRVLRRLMSIAGYEEFMAQQYERLKDKTVFVSLDEN